MQHHNQDRSLTIKNITKNDLIVNKKHIIGKNYLFIFEHIF